MAVTRSSDALLARCRSGDQNAWRDVVERYARYVRAIAISAYRLSEHDAEDVFQEVFARTWRNLDTIRDDEALKPWIGQVTRRLCIDRLRVTKRVDVADADWDVDPAAPDVLEQLDLALDVHAALAELSDDCREIVDRFFARDQSYTQISEQTGIAQGTIASRISRCLAKLRERLS